MYCKKCGSSLDDDALFCENCGTRTKKIELEKSKPVSAPHPVSEEIPPTNDFIAEEKAPAANEPVTAKKSPMKWILIGGLAVVAIVVLALFALGGFGNDDSFYHEINYNNVAFFAYDKDRLYFIAAYNEDDDDTSVYSTDYNGINKKLLSGNGNIVRIRVIDGKLYYYESGDDEYNIGVMNTDGTDNRIITSADEYIDKFAVSDNQLYYYTDSGLYTCNLNGENKTLLIHEVDTFTAGNGVLYYVYEDVINVYNLKNNSSTELCRAPGAEDLALDGNILYFACDTGLSCVDVKGDGTVTKIVRDGELDSYVFYEDYIYYKHTYDDDEIESLAEYFAETSSEITTYEILFMLIGDLYQANPDGSNPHEVENTDDGVLFTLYTSPAGMYYKFTGWSEELDKVEFE